jgi:hypothetical protein
VPIPLFKRRSSFRVGLYVDAFNLYYGARKINGKGTPGWRWLDIPALALGLVDHNSWPNSGINKFIYCTALRTRDGDPSSQKDQEIYISALAAKYPYMRTELGYYVPRVKSGYLVDSAKKPQKIAEELELSEGAKFNLSKSNDPHLAHFIRASVSTFEEKGSDVNLASNLLFDVFKRNIDAAIVISNDSDLRLPLHMARERIHVGLLNPTPRPTNEALQGDSDFGVGRHWWHKITQSEIRAAQLPIILNSISIPEGW